MFDNTGGHEQRSLEGGMIDEVSGNDVPTGSTREEVRDDIPAQLSEGEFVFPADVKKKQLQGGGSASGSISK